MSGVSGAPRSLFVTGMLRSGTTLLDKLLHSHPQLTVASQPFFSFYVQSKLAFLGPQRQRLPFTPQFMDPPGRGREDFDRWLAQTRLDGATLRAIEQHCTDAKGQGSPSLRDRAFALEAALFFGVWRQLHAVVAEVYGMPQAGGYIGSKEVLCEEFVPHLAASGARCIVSVRDPRAVIASLNRGNYRKSVGDIYPILLNVRNWRKSVAYYLESRGRRGVLGLRYEDLVVDGVGTLDRVAAFLGISAFDPLWYKEGLRDQEGQPWHGNSSFDAKQSLDAASVEQWRRNLNADTIRLIEFCAYPELLALGYKVGANAWQPDALTSYQEDPAQLRQDYLRDYGLTAANVAAELERREWLRSEAKPDAARRRSLFLSDAAYDALRAAVRDVR